MEDNRDSQYPKERSTRGQDVLHDDQTESEHDSGNGRAPSRRASYIPSVKLLSSKLGQLESTVNTIKSNVDKLIESLPSKSTDVHDEHHEDYAQVLKDRKEKEDDEKKLKKELKDKMVKTIAQAVFMAFMVILGLGMQAQFSKWVNGAIEERAAAQHSTSTKEGDKK